MTTMYFAIPCLRLVCAPLIRQTRYYFGQYLYKLIKTVGQYLYKLKRHSLWPRKSIAKNLAYKIYLHTFKLIDIKIYTAVWFVVDKFILISLIKL